MAAAVEINRRTTVADIGQSLFEVADGMDVRIPTSCLKNGKCRECLVEVTEGDELLTPRTPEEQYLTGRFRLSCRARIAKEGRIACQSLRRERMKIEDDSADIPLRFSGVDLRPALTKKDSRIYRKGRFLAAGNEIYGIALDIGTTTVAMRLIDLATGELIHTAAFENPQRFAGSNVMSRILFDSEHRGKLQQRTLVGYLCHALEDMPVDPMDIYEMVVVGNTTMRDLFFGLKVDTVGKQPFCSLTELAVRDGTRGSTTITTHPKRLGLPLNPQALVIGLPLVSAHVGADAAACLLAIDIFNQPDPILLMDIGTNTEILCGNRDWLKVTSCPAGPAFEGGAISCGMPSLRGAIERIRFDDNGDLDITIIDHDRADGICGSGLVDLLDGLKRRGLMDQMGRLAGNQDRFVVIDDDRIHLTEGDISELAQAKGANTAGYRILMEQTGLGGEEIHRLYLAGGFAKHLNAAAAKSIGLIPDVVEERISQLGNAALEGASIALCSLPHREQLERLAAEAEHVPLEQHPRFFDYYVEGCLFD